MHLHEFEQADFELLSKESCYEGFFSFQRFHFRHKRFDGTWSGEVAREVLVRGDATSVLIYDPALDSVLLVEQVRVGATAHHDAPWLLELVAGINDKNESPETIAKREAQEEAGVELSNLTKICEFYPSPGACTEKAYLYCAYANLSDAEGIYGLPEEDEDIRVKVLPLSEAIQMIELNQIVSAPAIIGLQWLELKKYKGLHQSGEFVC